MNSVKGRQTESDAELHTRRHMLAARQKNSHTDEQYRLTDEQADRQLDRQTERHKHAHGMDMYADLLYPDMQTQYMYKRVNI